MCELKRHPWTEAYGIWEEMHAICANCGLVAGHPVHHDEDGNLLEDDDGDAMVILQ